jgi:two-component system phosphate regulon sensor histidine kinase PhoR
LRALWKKFLKNYLIILVVVSPIVLLILSNLQSASSRLQKESLLREATLIAEALKPSLYSEDLVRKLSYLARETGHMTAVIGGDGKVMAGSTPSGTPSVDMGSFRELPGALKGLRGAGVTEIGGVKMVYAAVPLAGEERGAPYALLVSTPLKPLNKSFLAVKRDILIATLMLSGLVLLLTLTSSRAFSRSLDSVIRISEEIARGNFDVEIPSGEKGDTGKFGRALRLMAEKLKDLFNQAAYEKSQLETVLGTMAGGVMVVSETGSVVLMNDSLKNMLGVTGEHVGKPYWEVVRNKDIRELLDKTMESRIPDKREIAILYPLDRSYQAVAHPLNEPTMGTMLIMFDITEFKRLEKIKADFVANVSHELRTPLTAVKGYIETIKDGAYESDEQLERFLDIVSKHTERLINIVNDLLVLSEVEKKSVPWGEETQKTLEDTDLKKVLVSALDALKPRIDAKNINFTMEITESQTTTRGDGFLLEQMFINLIDNAVKYTPEGGAVKVTLSKADSAFRVDVEDSGIGIPKEHIPRIFERFYRVDKTRSRKEGGTGLGLSIVKHIAIMHGGKVEVESTEGKGSKFTVTLPSPRKT